MKNKRMAYFKRHGFKTKEVKQDKTWYILEKLLILTLCAYVVWGLVSYIK